MPEPEPEPELELELELELEPEPEPVPEPEPEPEPAPGPAPPTARIVPPPAGSGPTPQQAEALLAYVRERTGVDHPGGVDHIAGVPPEVDELVRRYLATPDLEGVRLTVIPERQDRGGAYYARIDIAVEPVPIFQGLVPSRAVSGPTVSSRISFLDAELESLRLFPLEELERAVLLTRVRTDSVVRRRGLPWIVREEGSPPGDRRYLVHAVLRSIGMPDSPEARWWLFLPPREIVSYLNEYLTHHAVSVDMDVAIGTIVIRYEEDAGRDE